MTPDEFRKHAHELVEWMAGYMENVENYPVKAKSAPGEILAQLPDSPPLSPEPFADVMNDFLSIIIPGISHWQSPSFFAYFPANTSPPSVLAEMLTATLGAQCMIWETSPAATELEQKMMNWLRDITGLPKSFEGVIQDTASTATLAALLTAREKATGFAVNETGFEGSEALRVYCSAQTHSSAEKAVKIAGIGRKNLVKIPVRNDYSIDTALLKDAIENDLANGLKPCCVIATLGTTGTTAVDNLSEIGPLCAENNIWLHVDAALAGTALILPEFRWMSRGIEHADSFVFNPHKWMFTNFDCTAYFVKDAQALIRTFEILPEYLKTRTRGKVNDYRDWGVPLGRRFRALKLWFVIRSYGIEGLQQRVRDHISYAAKLSEMVSAETDFEIKAPVILNTVCFRYKPAGYSGNDLNRINEELNHRLNDSGSLYLTHTVLHGEYVLRMVTSQTNLTFAAVEKAWLFIKETARAIKA
jgi:aromatic-L-amino-acid decarboxylase